MAKFKVLTVMPGITPDAGAEQSLAAMVPKMLAEGVELHLALLTKRQSLVPDLEAQGVIVHDLSSHTTTLARARALRTVIAAVSPAVVHATLFEATMPARLAVVRTSTPMLVTWASTLYSEELTRPGGPNRAKLRMVQAADLVVGRLAHAQYHAVTSGVGRVNARSLRVDARRVHVGERGRDADAFARTDPTGAALRAELGLAADAPLVLGVGRHERQKGYETLLEAFDVAAAHHPDARLLIAGRSGGATADLERQIASMAHGHRVMMLGQRDDISDLLSAAAVVVCSSWREGAAGALIEAMACATPILSVELAGLEDVLVDGHNARVVPRERLGEGLDEMLAEPDMAHRLAAAGRATFLDRFTIDRASQRMVEIYRAVAAA